VFTVCFLDFVIQGTENRN